MNYFPKKLVLNKLNCSALKTLNNVKHMEHSCPL